MARPVRQNSHAAALRSPLFRQRKKPGIRKDTSFRLEFHGSPELEFDEVDDILETALGLPEKVVSDD